MAGALAVTVNTLMLYGASRVGLQTGHGGMLKLVDSWLASVLDQTGVARAWVSKRLLAPRSPGFKIGFHVLVGMLMAAGYAATESYVHFRAWLKGLTYAVVVYLANALVVLPLLGDGIAGIRSLSNVGLIYFAFAHTTFFLLLALCYARWRRSDPMA